MTIEQFELICEIAAEPCRSNRCCLAYALIRMLRGNEEENEKGLVDLRPPQYRKEK